MRGNLKPQCPIDKNKLKKNRAFFYALCVVPLLSFTVHAVANPTLSAINTLIAQKTRTDHPSRFSAVRTQHARYALVLFFSSRCVHCQRFTPGFMRLAKQDHLTVYAYSADGQGLPAAPNPLMATPQVMHTFFVNTPAAVPTVFAINTKTLAYTMVSQGEVSPQVMAQKLAPYVAFNQQRSAGQST